MNQNSMGNDDENIGTVSAQLWRITTYLVNNVMTS